jgi:hypothetical protein
MLERVDWSSFGRPCTGERVSGDVAVVVADDRMLFLSVVDVLGHGKEAYDLACKARDFLKQQRDPDVSATMARLHGALKGSRGAAVGLSSLDLSSGRLRSCLVGNTVARKIGRRSDRVRATEGIVGHHMPSPRTQDMILVSADVLLLYTDGVQDRFGEESLAPLAELEAWDIARNVVKKFGRRFDDATCIALRYVG